LTAQGEVLAEGVGGTAVVDATELRIRYDAYRHRQASLLLQILPREAVRPLYRRARDMARSTGDLTDGPAVDPMALLVGYCERLLPLPPFEVWREDLTANPDAHLTDLGRSPEGPTADAPSTVAAQSVGYAGRRWMARLRAFRDGGFWRGYIAFEEEGRGPVHRTTAVFCERDPGELRRRFLSFDPAALEAFLRSALP
jgi:hypothetical protein